MKVFIFSLTFATNKDIIIIGNGETTNVAWHLDMKKHIATVKLQMCFLFVYLLKYKIVIIKANTIIVSTTKANKSKYIISNKNASIIAPPPFLKARPLYV